MAIQNDTTGWLAGQNITEQKRKEEVEDNGREKGGRLTGSLHTDRQVGV